VGVGGRGDLVQHLLGRPVAAVRLLDAAVRRRHGAGARAPQPGEGRVGFDRRDGAGIGLPGRKRREWTPGRSLSSARASISIS
jgi:hypothetical protein